MVLDRGESVVPTKSLLETLKEAAVLEDGSQMNHRLAMSICWQEGT